MIIDDRDDKTITCLCSRCFDSFRTEFQRNNLNFDKNTSHGVIEDWRFVFGRGIKTKGGRVDCSSFGVTVLVRAFAALLMLSIWLWSTISSISHGKYATWWLFLTHLTLTGQVVYHVLSLIVALKVKNVTFVDDTQRPMKLPFIVKTTWCLQAIILPATFFVFTLYFGFVFKHNLTLLKFSQHGLNFIVMGIDTFISGFPFLLIHGIYFIICAFLYLLLTIAAAIAGNAPIYDILDWSRPLTPAILCICLICIALPLVNTGCWWICRGRALYIDTGMMSNDEEIDQTLISKPSDVCCCISSFAHPIDSRDSFLVDEKNSMTRNVQLHDSSSQYDVIKIGDTHMV